MVPLPCPAPASESLHSLDEIEVFATCPQSKDYAAGEYVDRVAEVARWSEEVGCKGILVYTENSLVDPWLVSQIVLQHTERLCPLVAVQPIYMHPYSAAKMIASLGMMHGRKLYLNILAGGFRNDLLALGDPTPHDERYARAVEYTQVVRRLLESSRGVTFQGRYYSVTNLKLTPQLPPELMPEILISGSSAAGMAAARAIGATAVRYPQPAGEETGVDKNDPVPCGIRVGLVARDDDQFAWQIARERFPENRKGQITHRLAMRVSDSQWHKQLSERSTDEVGETPYWLGPFQNYNTFCPYLVGSYDRVATEVANYLRLGYRTFILDIPPRREELEHAGIVFDRALELASV